MVRLVEELLLVVLIVVTTLSALCFSMASFLTLAKAFEVGTASLRAAVVAIASTLISSLVLASLWLVYRRVREGLYVFIASFISLIFVCAVAETLAIEDYEHMFSLATNLGIAAIALAIVYAQLPSIASYVLSKTGRSRE